MCEGVSECDTMVNERWTGLALRHSTYTGLHVHLWKGWYNEKPMNHKHIHKYKGVPGIDRFLPQTPAEAENIKAAGVVSE